MELREGTRYNKFGLPPTDPPPIHQETFLRLWITPNQYCMTSNHAPFILVFKMTFRVIFRTTFRMTFRITFRMTFRITFRMARRMTFETCDFVGGIQGGLRRGYWGVLQQVSKNVFEGIDSQSKDVLTPTPTQIPLLAVTIQTHASPSWVLGIYGLRGSCRGLQTGPEREVVKVRSGLVQLTAQI